MMHGIFSSASSAVAVLGVLVAAQVHLTVGGSLPGDAHGLRVNEGEREAHDSVSADRLFPLNSADDGNAERLLRMSSGTRDFELDDQLVLREAVSAVAAAAERSRSLPLLRILLLATQQQQQQQRQKTSAASSATGSSLNRGFRRQSGLSGTTGRLKRIKPQHDITGTGTLRYV